MAVPGRQPGTPGGGCRPTLRDVRPRPLTRDQVLGLIAQGIPTERAITLVSKRGVDFWAEDACLDTLRRMRRRWRGERLQITAAGQIASHCRAVLSSQLSSSEIEIANYDCDSSPCDPEYPF